MHIYVYTYYVFKKVHLPTTFVQLSNRKLYLIVSLKSSLFNYQTQKKITKTYVTP